MEIATAAAIALPSVPGGLSAVVQLSDPDLAAALNERMAAQADGEAPLRFTSLLHDGATAMVRRHPPPADGACMVVGLTPFAEALLAAAARYNRTIRGDTTPLQVVVVDPQGGRRMARFGVLRPAVAAHLSVEVVEADADSPDLDAWLARRRDGSAPPVAQAYVCADDERRALSTAIHLARRLPAAPVIVQTTSSGESAGRFLGSGRTPETASRIHVFGLIEETCSMELLLDPRNEVIARALHEEYLRHRASATGRPGADAANRPWSELDDEWREANRDHAREIRSALRSIGIDVLPNDDAVERLLTLTDDEVETLARAEHERWTADRLRRGWTPGPRDDGRRRHPDLVAWDQLSPDSKEIDRALVRARPKLLARAGFALSRSGREGPAYPAGRLSARPGAPSPRRRPGPAGR